MVENGVVSFLFTSSCFCVLSILRENHKAEANISGSESTCFRDGKKEIDMICFFVFFFCPLVERQMKM